MTQGIVTAAYIGASIMFILALGGLSRPETSRRGNFFGILGMILALSATVIGIVSNNYFILIAGILMVVSTFLCEIVPGQFFKVRKVSSHFSNRI
ncbi:NAD(P)(+) transhydrogenase (Re/Si-specific) subunit beta [Desulfomarina sp.]